VNDPEREQELWQRVAAAGQPDAKKRRGMAAALERYYQAIGLRRTGRRHGGDDGEVPGVDPVERIRGTE
jgi:hypothetical protein